MVPQEESLKRLRRNDFFVSAVLWLISLLAAFDSFRLTFDVKLPGVTQSPWLVSPGILPLFLSTGLLVMLSALMWTSFRATEFKGHVNQKSLVKAVTTPEFINKLLHIVLLCVYVLVLIGNIHFGVASALYICGAMLLSKAAKLYQIVLISVLFSAAVTYLFGTVMKIPLP